MGKIRDMLSSGMTDGERKEVEQALRQLSALHGKLSAKYTLADNLEHITDGRTAAAKLIKSEIESLQLEIHEIKEQKKQLSLEISELLDLKNKVSDIKQLIDYQYDDGVTTRQTLQELLEPDNLANLYNEADKLNNEFQKYFTPNEGEELSYSQKLEKLSSKNKELYSYLFNNDVVVEGIETSREQAIKKKYQEIDEYYNYLFNDEVNESGDKISSFSTMFDKQKASLDKFYLKIFGDDQNPSLEKILSKRLETLEATEKEAVKVLNQASNAGLAGGFHEKGKQARNRQVLNAVIFIGVLILLVYFNFNTIDFTKLDKISLTSITVRLILNIPLIWIATVANINLNKYSKLEQEYGHKEALARSFEKYKSEISDLNSENDDSIYLQTKLLEINLDAFKKNPSDGMETAKSDSLLEKILPSMSSKSKDSETST
ncbi:hypothetical protein [Acinetobacter sp. YH16031]|uniref:hypothetical protein n=1 Tax=Acinetobacter sp. YH16031 TaxID=2601180 RepID=UPI0015D1E0A8|nr:hypothetical protein [Acinetobacter sp. YH16031]